MELQQKRDKTNGCSVDYKCRCKLLEPVITLYHSKTITVVIVNGFHFYYCLNDNRLKRISPSCRQSKSTAY